MSASFDAYREVLLVDFEFTSNPGECQNPVCLVAREFKSGKTIRLWRDQFGPEPPYPTDPGVLFVAYYASAELGCHKTLGWPMPANILDLYIEFREHTNGLYGGKWRLLDAMAYYGLNCIGVEEKEDMRNLILSGGPWSSDEREAILAYCETDVIALNDLLPVMTPRLDLPYALLRGKYMIADALMRFAGVPIDVDMLKRLKYGWEAIQDRLIADVDASYGVYEGRTFKQNRFETYVVKAGIPWPRLDSGALDLDKDTFKDMQKAYPIIAELRELRHSLSDMRLSDIVVGEDGRNRPMLSAFGARSSRNTPSNTKYIFGPSIWLRGLVMPPPGYGLAYVDWSQQEFGIAADLSGDPAMLDAYNSGDPYLAFAKQARAVPSDGTKKTHGAIRDLYKTCVLGVQYGMGRDTLAYRIGHPSIIASELLRAHHETYPKFWEWSDAAVDTAMLHNELQTTFGWHIRIGGEYFDVSRQKWVKPNPRSLRNFPMQGNGAEMLRFACCMACDRGIEVCASIHDAVLICAPLNRLLEDAERMREVMAEASNIVLSRLTLRADATFVAPAKFFAESGFKRNEKGIFVGPAGEGRIDRYMDLSRGLKMWDKVQTHLDALDGERQARRA